MGPAAGAHFPPSRAISLANSTSPTNQGMLIAVMRPNTFSAVRALASSEGSRQ